MTFTDDDLKRLKEMIEAYDPSLKLPALLARLEAAEVIVSHDAEIRRSHLTIFEKDLIKAWRESKGE